MTKPMVTLYQLIADGKISSPEAQLIMEHLQLQASGLSYAQIRNLQSEQLPLPFVAEESAPN